MPETRIAYCPFCHNSVMVPVDETYIEIEDSGNEAEIKGCEEWLNKQAVKYCDCSDAFDERKLVAQKEMATASIEEMISQEYPASGKAMIDAIDIIQREGVRSVTIITGDNAKLILKSKGDGLLVRKQKTKSEEVLN